MNVIKKSISLLPLLTEVISQTIKEQVEMPADTVYRMKNNIYPDFWETYEALTYCNFLKYWKNKYNKFYDADWGSAYAQPVKDAFEKHKTDKITLRLLNTFSKIENGGRATGGSGCYGLFQYCKEWFSSYGIKNKEEAENPDIATRQFVKYATSLGKSMSNMSGKNVFEPENQWILYLGWQQGKGGTTKIYNGCEDVETFKGEELYVSTPEIIGPIDSEDIFLGKDVIEKGDANELVAFIQNLLIYNYDIGVGEDGADGVFLDDTHDAVLEFQNRFGLTPDGVIGPCTYDTLVEKRVRYCCKIGACQEDYCKDSQWCTGQKKFKKDKKVDKKSDVKGCGVVAKKLPSKFKEIPGGNNNFRTNQPSLGQLAYIFEKYPQIETVVRMNAEEDTGVTIDAEKDCVETTGRKFVWVNAHEGYKPNEGYVQSMNKVLPYLEEGNTLIHCTAGKDRTGFMVARYLKDISYTDWSDEELYDYTVAFNSWEKKGYICNGTAYSKYMEGFYTIKNWCSFDVENRLNKCKVCKEYKS